MRANGWIAAVATVGLLVGLGLLLRWGDTSSSSPSQNGQSRSLMVYCAAGIKPPIEAAIKQYEQEYDVDVDLQYGGSGTLLASITASRVGDLFVAAEDFYLQLGRDKGVVQEVLPLASQRAVLAVRKDGDVKIESLDSLLDGELRIGMANPEAAAVGKASQQLLERAGLWDEVKQAVEERGVFKPTVTDLANDLRVGTIDVAIVWDATVLQYADLRAIVIDDDLQTPQNIALGVLSSSSNPTAALHLARWLGARDRGLNYFREEGYQVAEGDVWAERPEMTVYLGGMLRLATDDTVRRFAEREGVTVNTVYNGCGILVGQIKTGSLPDAYFACDTTFMDQVADVFTAPRNLASSRMMVVVRKGNPKGIEKLADLTQEGLQVGVCNPQQSALGALTENLLKRNNLLDDVMHNVVYQSPTADLLVTQLETGGLDAAIVYEVNYTPSADTLDGVFLDDPTAMATQPLAVGKKTSYPQLASRLVEVLRAEPSRQRFIENGFTWLDEQPLHDSGQKPTTAAVR